MLLLSWISGQSYSISLQPLIEEELGKSRGCNTQDESMKNRSRLHKLERFREHCREALLVGIAMFFVKAL